MCTCRHTHAHTYTYTSRVLATHFRRTSQLTSVWAAWPSFNLPNLRVAQLLLVEALFQPITEQALLCCARQKSPDNIYEKFIENILPLALLTRTHATLTRAERFARTSQFALQFVARYLVKSRHSVRSKSTRIKNRFFQSAPFDRTYWVGN